MIRRSAHEMASAMESGEITSEKLTQEHYARIDAVESEVHAFLYLDRDGALAQAKSVDAARARGEKLGPLAGVPLALKDVMVQKDVPTTCGSKILEGWRPPYDATVVTKLKKAGVVILGKTNMDEFAIWVSDILPRYLSFSFANSAAVLSSRPIRYSNRRRHDGMSLEMCKTC